MSCVDVQLAELQSLIAHLGKDGGLISPSIYDTAQVVRYYPPPEGPDPAIGWLLDQQQPDGGWGEPSAPYARDVPTLATILALHTHKQNRQTTMAIDAGLAFLRRQAEQWRDIPLDALFAATEMILPQLIHQANAAGLSIDPQPYSNLFKLREHKCQQIRKLNPQAGSAPTYSWEAWGSATHTPPFDSSGGIGHSPSATAAWLQQTKRIAHYRDFHRKGCDYLQKAAMATCMSSNIPGVVPNVWPITGFERAYGPYILWTAGLLLHPVLQAPICLQLNELEKIITTGNGVSFGEYFSPDVDETSLTVATLHTMQRPCSVKPLMQFKNGNHFYTLLHELNPSVFSNAHALHALTEIGQQDVATEQFLLSRQGADGRWLADKWHSSWIYTTLEVVLALSRLGYIDEINWAVNALLKDQNRDGGWGADQSSQLETSYAVLALYYLQRLGLLMEEATAALGRAQQWLSHHYHPYALLDERKWVGKELYAPYRVDRIYILCANLTAIVVQEDICLQNAIPA